MILLAPGWISIRRGLESVGLTSAILVVAALVVVQSLRDQRTGLAAAIVLLVGSIVFVNRGRGNLFVNHGWIPFAWIALCFSPEFRLTFRSALDTSVSSASAETLLQVGLYAVVAALVIRTRRLLIRKDPTPIRKGPLVAWPLLALLSTLWSPIPSFTLVRSLQLFVSIGLATVMVRIWLSSPSLAASLWRDTVRFFVRTVTFLTLLGFSTSSLSGFASGYRFAWPGTHPGVVAAFCATALVILVASGRSYLGVRLSGFVFRLLLFASAIYLSQTRAVLAALAVAIAVLIWWKGRTNLASRYIGAFYYVVAITLMGLAASDQVLRYLERGASLQENLSLTGRLPLWGIALDLIGDADRWLIGFGYGSGRVILPLHAEWAGTAHSSWIELLLSIGVLGPFLLAAGLFYVLRYAPSIGAIVSPRVVMGVIVLLAVTSLTGEQFALPGMGFTLLALMYVPVLVWRNASFPRARSGSLIYPRGHDERLSLPPQVVGS